MQLEIIILTQTSTEFVLLAADGRNKRDQTLMEPFSHFSVKIFWLCICHSSEIFKILRSLHSTSYLL